MRCSVLNSLLILVIILFPLSQASSSEQELNVGNLAWVPPLGIDFKKALFKGSLDIREHHLTGLLFIKKTSDSSYRIVFNNEIGMKFFDLELFREDYKVHYCFPSLSRKSLLKILETDFRILLTGNLSDVQKNSLVERTTDTSIFKIISTSGKYLVTVDNLTSRIIEISSIRQMMRKTRVSFTLSEDIIPKKINIQNPLIKLSFKLTRLDS